MARNGWWFDTCTVLKLKQIWFVLFIFESEDQLILAVDYWESMGEGSRMLFECRDGLSSFGLISSDWRSGLHICNSWPWWWPRFWTLISSIWFVLSCNRDNILRLWGYHINLKFTHFQYFKRIHFNWRWWSWSLTLYDEGPVKPSLVLFRNMVFTSRPNRLDHKIIRERKQVALPRYSIHDIWDRSKLGLQCIFHGLYRVHCSFWNFFNSSYKR